MAQTTPSPAPRVANPLRFSLRTLLEIMTYAAIACWALFSRELYRDESVFLLCFPVAIWLGRYIGLWRQRSGILEGALGGSISCALASLLASEQRPRQLDLAEYLALSIPAGFLLGAVFAGCYWLLLDAPPNCRPWRRALVGTMLGAGVAGLSVWGYRLATDWSPRFELIDEQYQELQTHPDTRRICAFSRQGNYLAWQWENHWYGMNKKRIQLFQIEGRRLKPVQLDALTPDVWSIVFAPDERSVAFLKIRETSLRMHVIDMQGREIQSAEVRSQGYYFSDNQLTFNRDGREIFACWHTEHVRQWTAYASDSLQEQRSHSFAFVGRLFVSPSGKWLVKLHQKRTTDYFDRSIPSRAEIAATADLKVVREYEVQVDLRVPPESTDEEHLFLAQVINEMFPGSKIRIARERGPQGQGVLTVRGYAKDGEESQQIVSLIRSQVNGPTRQLQDSGDVERVPQLRVMNLLDDLSLEDGPVFDPDETCLAFGRRVMKLSGAADDKSVTELPGKVIGLLPKGRALLLVHSEPEFQTRIPFLRHWFPERGQSHLCLVDVASGKTLRRSIAIPSRGFDFHLAQDGRTAVGFSYAFTLQVWDIPQLD